MRVVFMGTPEFAVAALRALAANHLVVSVYTRTDSPSARGSALRPSPVKAAAAEIGITVRQPRSLREPAETAALAADAPDVVCVAAYGLILPPEVLAVPRLGCVNVHASLLPRHRGAAPIQRAILEGDPTTGVSIMRMEEGLDTGPYAEQVPVEVDRLDSAALTAELAAVGADALLRVLDRMDAGTVLWSAQDEDRATYAPKVSRNDVALSPDLGIADADRRVRASSASARCAVTVAGSRLVVLAAEPSDASVPPGAVASGRDGLRLGLADGALALTRVRPEGRPEMDGAAYARGARLSADATWAPEQ